MNKNLNKKKIKKSIFKTMKSMSKILPIIITTIGAISLVDTLLPPKFYHNIFNSLGLDWLVGAIVGSVSAGNPSISYILASDLLKQGVSMFAVVAFLLTWVTVGVVQMPAESKALGTRFSVLRNVISFGLAILGAFLVSLVV